jgi:hypothetical protein
MVYNNVAKMGQFDTACCEWRNMPPSNRTWEAFNTRVKTAYKDLHFLVTTGSLCYHGASHMVTSAEASVLDATQAKPRTAEDALVVALVRHNIAPTASVATTASSVSAKASTTVR